MTGAARNIRELVALSKKIKGGLNYGSNGSGTSLLTHSGTGSRITSHVPRHPLISPNSFPKRVDSRDMRRNSLAERIPDSVFA